MSSFKCVGQSANGRCSRPAVFMVNYVIPCCRAHLAQIVKRWVAFGPVTVKQVEDS